MFKSRLSWDNPILILLSLVLFSAFSSLSPANAEVTPIFNESFDSLASITAHGGTYSNISIVPGKSGSGVLIQGTGNIVYPAANRFNFLKGTIEFWVKPNWDGGIDQNGVLKYFLRVVWGTTQNMDAPVYALSPPGRVLNMFMPRFNDRGTSNRLVQSREPDTIMQWKPNVWHKVVIYWDLTIPDDASGAHQSYLITKIDDIFSSRATFAPIAYEAPVADARIIIGQDHVVGRYPANAVIDELKIYDTSLLPMPFPEYQFNPFYPETEKTFRQLFENDGVRSNWETYNTQPTDCPQLGDDISLGEKVLFFQKPPFEQVYENYVPKTAEINNKFSYQAPKGEYETIFFNVYSRVDLNNVVVNYTQFQGVNGTIPKANLDLRVVKNWFQASRGGGTVADPFPIYVPELLLHNDQIPLETDQTLSQFKVPSIPILDHVETKISQYTSRQFAMIVNVPAGTPSGSYFSTVTLSAPGISNKTVTLGLEVLPFSLQDSGKINSMWYTMATDRPYALRMGIDQWEILRRDLADIKKHGINTVFFLSYTDMDYSPLTPLEVQTRKIQRCQEMGFRKVIIYTGTRMETLTQDIPTALPEMMMQYGFEPWIFGLDEIGELGLDYLMQPHISRSKYIHEIGGKVATVTIKAASDALDDPNHAIYNSFPPGTYEPLDWVTYPAFESYEFNLMAGTAQKNPNKIETFYWQSRDENPQTNRYFFGYYPWVTGLDGATISYYRQGGSKNQYYNDFDWTDPTRRFRPYAQTYPSIQGPVPTIQWEAAREGIKDGKYLATWKYYKDNVAKTYPAIAQQSEDVVNNMLERYRDRVPTSNSRLYMTSMAQYEMDRQAMINEIKKLITYCNGNIKSRH